MRHKKLNKRLGRNKSQRKQLLKSLVRGLFISYKIETTLVKAKETRKLADKIIRYAKSGSLKDIRFIESVIQDKSLISKIVKLLAPLSKDRKGGYTRIVKAGFRRGDGAEMAILELTDMPVREEKQKKSVKQKAKTQISGTSAEEAKKAKKPEPKTKEKVKESVSPEAEEMPSKPKPPVKAEKKEMPKAKTEKEKKAGPDKRGLFGKFKGFFKQQ
jgi:large subunit ribosomal protein L17